MYYNGPMDNEDKPKSADKTVGKSPTYKYNTETRVAAANRLAMARMQLVEKMQLKYVVDRDLCEEIATLVEITTEMI